MQKVHYYLRLKNFFLTQCLIFNLSAEGECFAKSSTSTSTSSTSGTTTSGSTTSSGSTTTGTDTGENSELCSEFELQTR